MSSLAKQFTLGKNERLKSRKQIELLFSKGKKIAVAPFRIFFQIKTLSDDSGITHSEKSILQFGAGVSTKNFKKAADRNRIRRLIREVWRLQKNDLKEKLALTNRQLQVFFIYIKKDLPDYNEIFKKTGTAVKKLTEEIERTGK